MKDFDLGTIQGSTTGMDAFFESEPAMATPLTQTSPLQAPAPPPQKTASKQRIKIGSLNQLSGFVRVAEDQLVNKSSEDLWALRKDSNGGFYIERLFDDTGGPLKG